MPLLRNKMHMGTFFVHACLRKCKYFCIPAFLEDVQYPLVLPASIIQYSDYDSVSNAHVKNDIIIEDFLNK